jgi:hypothetical protein
VCATGAWTQEAACLPYSEVTRAAPRLIGDLLAQSAAYVNTAGQDGNFKGRMADAVLSAIMLHHGSPALLQNMLKRCASEIRCFSLLADNDRSDDGDNV